MRACGACGSWTYLPRMSAAEQAATGEDDGYFEHPYFKLRRQATPAQRRRCRDVFARLSQALDLSALRGEPLLDVGSDTGTFLKMAQEELGIVPVGVDISRRAVEASRKLGVEAYCSAIETAPGELAGFRAITAIDLIEHVPDPAAFLRGIWQRLRPGGVADLETPNIRSLVYRFGQALSNLTGARPAGLIQRLFPPQHVQYFTPSSLRCLAERAGFQVVQLLSRRLPLSDIGASIVPLLAMAALQTGDRFLGTQILLCLTIRRPLEDPS